MTEDDININCQTLEKLKHELDNLDQESKVGTLAVLRCLHLFCCQILYVWNFLAKFQEVNEEEKFLDWAETNFTLLQANESEIQLYDRLWKGALMFRKKQHEWLNGKYFSFHIIFDHSWKYMLIVPEVCLFSNLYYVQLELSSLGKFGYYY